ncbi:MULTISPECIES: hypothetical protein [Roseomonadaceae]|uniref:Uncharacterized protein n=1 Tax=Falsiroseomonas oleicola TaxID=2801474 RepID=A0ABS6HC38_9PROT|nr:hypothetical protein [Roseomonas oleicola]MBU8546243.1 hypothetical protein [Roseomonas oleicola]
MAIAALVLDARKEFGTDTAVAVNKDGVQTAVLRVASDDGGFIVPSKTATGKGLRLRPDDVVLWVPLLKGVALGNDERSAWIGTIVATIAPELDFENPEFRILCRYT